MLAPLEREARIDAGGKIFCRKLPTVIYDRSVSTLLENVWRALIVSLFFHLYMIKIMYTSQQRYFYPRFDQVLTVTSWKTHRSNKKLEHSRCI
jgi:hypothetical protein